jgi:hypothetical protein
MTKDNSPTLPFASLSSKKVVADFDGGTQSSDGGVLFLREVERGVGVIHRLARALRDRRHPSYVDHSPEDLLRQRVFQITCGYEDANDSNDLRRDPALKVACDRLPISGEELASQPTISRLENGASRTDLYRMALALVDTFLASYGTEPEAILLDIDDTDDPTHGAQQMTVFNGFYDEYCYLPLHIYEGKSGKLITTILRPGRRPSGKQIQSILKHLVRYIRKRWPDVMIFLRGDSHFSAPEVHEWCEGNDVHYALGQAGNKVLKEHAASLINLARSLYRESQRKVKLFTSFLYQADSWKEPRRVICKVEITERGENVRFVVTSLKGSLPSFIYQTIYCARGRMEGFIKNHKRYLLSDRTSCHSFQANQFRLFLHSAAYVLLHSLAEKGLKGTGWAKAQFDTIQKRILKVGARVHEMTTRIRFHLPTSFPLKALFATILRNLAAAFP